MLTGSLAASYHGIPRSTQDIDLVILGREDEVLRFVASAEDTLLAKLEWAKLGESEAQLRDAVGIIRSRREGLDRAYIERWAKELDLLEY